MDLTGLCFGQWTVLGLDTSNKSKQKHWMCQCKCGQIVSVQHGNLIYGKSKQCKNCRDKQTAEKRKNKLVKGDRFGNLTFLRNESDYISPSGYKKRRGLFQCDCGNFALVMISDVLSNKTQSCGCGIVKAASSRYHDITGMRFGKLIAEKKLCERRNKKIVWLCRCDCGGEKNVKIDDLVSGKVISCGCAKSLGEFETCSILNKWRIEYSTEYTLSNCVSSHGRRLPFDFAIFKNEILVGLIEYQGKQHYDESCGWFGRLEREETDKLKRDYCVQNNIPFFEIRYDEDTEVRLKQILDALHVNPVPDAAQSAA